MSDIKPKKIKTKNIQESIAEYAQEVDIAPDLCDFKITNFATYIKTSMDTSFRLFNENITEHYNDSSKIVNEHLELKQVYVIIVGKKPKPKLLLKYKIDFGEFRTNPVMILDPSSKLPFKSYKPKDLFILLVNELNKIKAYNGILVKVFDKGMIKTLKILVKYIYANKFKKRVKIPLFDGVEPEISRESKLIIWFEQQKSGTQIIEVEEGEILVEFIKPVYGHNGLNCHGEQISGGIGENKVHFEATIDAHSVETIEDDNRILYRSKIKGFVHFVNNTLKVDNKLKMSKISRVQESIAEDEDNNVEVIVSQHDTAEDSVGEGVKLTSETIHITGFVGAKSVLEAINLNIEGATHQDAKQYAKFAKINRHKGTLKCHDAKIKLLEGGEVHATYVDIESSIGGVIYAQDVTIDHVKNHLKVYASHSIKIRLVSGEDNLFKINYKDVPILNRKIEFLTQELEDLKYDLEEATRHTREKVPEIEEKMNTIKRDINYIKSSAKYATITVEQPFKGLNKIIFTLENDEEILYKTQEQKYEPFHLMYTEDKITLQPVNKSIPL